MTTRQAIVEEARTWLGTPYRHQANVKGLAVDCVNLVHEVLVSTGAMEPFTPFPAYRTRPDGTLRDLMKSCLIEKPLADRLPGDVLLFKGGMMAQDSHLALISYDDHIIHAYIGIRKTVEQNMDARWWSWVTGCFAAPEVE